MRGTCKLTGIEGTFVRAHLLPKALTKPAGKGRPFVQAGSGERPVRRWDSWYDPELVIRKGEDILTSHDTWGISELRRQKLVWSGWGNATELLDNHDKIPNSPWGVRTVKCKDPKRLRLFFLSLLWRAAASDRWEFAEISIPADHLEQLREMVIKNDAEPLSFYPTQLTQLSTRGEAQNFTPIATEKRVASDVAGNATSFPVFRFYMDGLAAHMARNTFSDKEIEELKTLFVGGSADLAVSTVTYEASFQLQNLTRMKSDVEKNWPGLLSKL